MMNKLYAEKHSKAIRAELYMHPELLNKLAEKVDSFIIWAGWQRLDYMPDLFDEVDSFLNSLQSNERVRMYNSNVKEWYRLIKIVFERDNHTCTYCGSVGGKLEADHIVPFSKGGSDCLENLTTSCRRCNRQKKDKTLKEFLQWQE